MKKFFPRVLLATLVLALASGLGWWARGVVTDRTEVGTQTSGLPVESADVVDFRVGKTYNFSVTISRKFEPVAVNHLAGTITWLNDQPVAAGDAIYEVDGVPIFAVAADEPFYRDLGPETKGEDVRQVQEFLGQAGFLASVADGTFGPATESAVKRWQKSVGLEQTGAIELGRVVAMPQLPTSVTFSEGFAKGMAAPVGEPVFEAPAGEPGFALRLTPTQSELVPMGSQVVMTGDGYEWHAVVVTVESNQDGLDHLVLTTAEGQALVCGDECGVLPANPEVTIPAVVEVEKPVEGPAVPVAAVLTRDDGGTFVIVDGEERDVTVLGSGSGMAVLDGVQTGDKVQLHAARANEGGTSNDTNELRTPAANDSSSGGSSPTGSKSDESDEPQSGSPQHAPSSPSPSAPGRDQTEPEGSGT